MFRTDGAAGVGRAPVMAAFGCGVDSSAMLLGLHERGLLPDVVLFADTGGEKPETYRFLFLFDRWLARHGFRPSPNEWTRPPGYGLSSYGLPESHPLEVVQVVRDTGVYGTLERNCLQTRTLPSLAYGRRGCSQKYKLRPQHQWARAWPPARRWWGLGGPRGERCLRPVVKLIGYSAEEFRRGDILGDDFYEYRYPLREWGWGRGDSLKAITRHGLPLPGKSACFFCPASRKREVIELGVAHPELLRRALELERAARESGTLRTVRGLGRLWSWSSLVDAGGMLPGMADPPAIGCVCQGEVREGDVTDGDGELDQDAEG
jgi:hypothetical protein